LCYVDKGGEENIYKGIDINHGIGDNKEAFVWEPLLVKVNALKAATEAACTILSIDETVRNPKSEQEEQQRRVKKSLPTAGRRR
jgi:T-complex protein 1 subunit eta